MTYEGTLRQVLIRVYDWRNIKSCRCPFLWFSPPPPPLPCVNTYCTCGNTVCNGGGGGIRQINTCAKSLYRSIFRWRHFALASIMFISPWVAGYIFLLERRYLHCFLWFFNDAINYFSGQPKALTRRNLITWMKPCRMFSKEILKYTKKSTPLNKFLLLLALSPMRNFVSNYYKKTPQIPTSWKFRNLLK